ncbi:unnamed protein product [Pleuronectes platessa]|uniref:Plus3 domain-containing protein n=1 Tax=Pleuronectes platessa TaxID=8262 RepID=A0A9N7TRY4_PLEPL|nr:unnamed protein product [Pleuronectes platessa]
MSPVAKSILFLVDVDASAASGRPLGSKKKRKVKHGKGPEEKKARGEVTQPALAPEELKRICLSSKRLEKWCHMPFLATTVTGCFVRAVFDDSISDPPHCVAEIVSVIEMKNDYKFGSKRTNLVLNLRHAGEEQIVTLRSVSNQEFTESEFKKWKLAMIAAGAKFPTPERIASKEKTIKEALDHTFTQGELDFIVAKLKRFGTVHLKGTKSIIHQAVDKRSAARRRGDAKKMESNLLVVSDGSAASGRSAGSKWKRQDQGAGEKKARGEVNQPALAPEELRRICLSRNMLEKLCHMPFFAATVTGCFIREDVDYSFGEQPQRVSEIVSVKEKNYYYMFGSKQTNLFLNLRHAGGDTPVSLSAVSSQEFTESEFKHWEAEMIAAGMKVPTPEMIATKEKSIKDAMDRFQAAHLKVPKRKITLLEYQRLRGDADRKFPVASAASAGTKRKRQVEQDQGPEEKKARGEVDQPAPPPEELRRICLSKTGWRNGATCPSLPPL